MREAMKPWVSLCIALAASLFGVTVGYSYSQSKLSNLVAVHTQQLSSIEGDISQMDRKSTEHMNKAIELFEQQMQVQREFIATIRIQNEILIKLTKP